MQVLSRSCRRRRAALYIRNSTTPTPLRISPPRRPEPPSMKYEYASPAANFTAMYTGFSHFRSCFDHNARPHSFGNNTPYREPRPYTVTLEREVMQHHSNALIPDHLSDRTGQADGKVPPYYGNQITKGPDALSASGPCRFLQPSLFLRAAPLGGLRLLPVRLSARSSSDPYDKADCR